MRLYFYNDLVKESITVIGVGLIFNMFNRSFVLTLFLLCFLLSSCVRFVDSRKALIDNYGDLDPAVGRVGIEGFFQFEQEQRVRLNKLIKERHAEASQASSQDYQLQSSDHVELAIRGFDEISKKYEIDPFGFISLPFVGKIKIAGLTESQAVKKLESSVADFVVDPQVDLRVSKYGKNVVWVVNNKNSNTEKNTLNRNSFPIKYPGYSLLDLFLEIGNQSFLSNSVVYFYPRIEDNNDLDLVKRFESFNVENWSASKDTEDCNAQEYTPDGAKFRVKACYPYENKVTEEDINKKYAKGARLEIDVEELLGGVTQPPLHIPLKPGDIIVIPTTPNLGVYGEVFRPGNYIAITQGGGSVGNLFAGPNPTLMSLLTQAGGLNYSADIARVQIYRDIHFGNKAILTLDLEKTFIWAGQDIKLRDGDIVYIPSADHRYFRSATVDAINRISGVVRNVDDSVTADFRR